MGTRSILRISVGLVLLPIWFASSAVADGTILTCTNLSGTSFNGPGGIMKPGWTSIAPENKYQVELAITNGKWDIIRANGTVRNSPVAHGCSVGMYPSVASPLDMLFIVTCQDEIETMLFYTREGQDRLITTTLSREAGSPGGAITETADCHKGN
jgi:hypothetical protein